MVLAPLELFANAFWPFDRLPLDSLRSSTKKVFALYSMSFPLSFDNRELAEDYYTKHYLSPVNGPGGLKNKGGHLRQRPLPQPVSEVVGWSAENMREEVRRASEIGIDGFTWNMLSLDRESLDWQRGTMLIDAAQEQDPTFKVVLMLDMSVLSGREFELANELEIAIDELSAYEGVLRLDDGRLVLVAYQLENYSPRFWDRFLGTMAERGVEIALVGLLQGGKLDLLSYRDLLYGSSVWGTRDPETDRTWRADVDSARSFNLPWGMAVVPQYFRPKSFVYEEAGNSGNFRAMWKTAIEADAAWVQVLTWNDYSEHTEVAPSTQTQWSFYDLTAYYVQWFKTGVEPQIKRDVLYYFYRIQAVDAPYDKAQQSRPLRETRSKQTRDEIELLAFLKEAGTLTIGVGDWGRDTTVAAGLHSFKVPLLPGWPHFYLKRHNRLLIELPGRFEIAENVEYQDFLYRGGSSARELAEQSGIAVETPRRSWSLLQSFSNPFNGKMAIRFSLQESSLVHITIYSLAGQKITDLASELWPAGEHAVAWDGTDALGAKLATGSYIYRLGIGGTHQARKLVLVR